VNADVSDVDVLFVGQPDSMTPLGTKGIGGVRFVVGGDPRDHRERLAVLIDGLRSETGRSKGSASHREAMSASIEPWCEYKSGLQVQAVQQLVRLVDLTGVEPVAS
jgi:hypothetical protein